MVLSIHVQVLKVHVNVLKIHVQVHGQVHAQVHELGKLGWAARNAVPSTHKAPSLGRQGTDVN
jgi:hypothetical protein